MGVLGKFLARASAPSCPQMLLMSQDWMSSLAGMVQSHNQEGTGQNADWSNLTHMVGHFNAAQANGGGAQEFQNKCAMTSCNAAMPAKPDEKP